jgi:hypothetical protein
MLETGISSPDLSESASPLGVALHSVKLFAQIAYKAFCSIFNTIFALEHKKSPIQCIELLTYVERSSQLSNQIVKDFKAIADLTYLLPMMAGNIGFDETRYKEA